MVKLSNEGDIYRPSVSIYPGRAKTFHIVSRVNEGELRRLYNIHPERKPI